MRDEKETIIRDPFLHFICQGEEYTQAIHVRLCVWSTIWPPSYQAFSNLSTDLDSLGHDGGIITIFKVMEPEMKKKILLETLFLILLPT